MKTRKPHLLRMQVLDSYDPVRVPGAKNALQVSNSGDQFQSAIAAAGLAVPEVIHGDGALHRYSSNGKRSDQSAWYVLHDDGDLPAGAFGCWRAGVSHTWCSKDVKPRSMSARDL